MDMKKDVDGGGEEGFKRYRVLKSDRLQITGSYNEPTFSANYLKSDHFHAIKPKWLRLHCKTDRCLSEE